MSIKTAVIGTGLMGFSQIKNCFSKLPQYEIVAVCDNHAQNLQKAVDFLHSKGKTVQSYSDCNTMLKDSDFDLAVIVTPDYLHEEQAIACLNAGKHIRLEKPLAITPEGCRNIYDAYKNSGVVFQIGLELRYSYLIKKMSAIKGQLGGVKMMWCHEFRHPFLEKTGSIENWIVQKKYSGGTLLEKNCHHFDLFNFMAEAKPISIYASGDNKTIYADTDVLDNAFVTVEYENGSRANLSLCLFAPEKRWQKDMTALELGLLGKQGRMEMHDDDLYFWDRETCSQEHYHFERDNHEAHSDDILPSLVELAECIQNGTQPLADIHAGINSAMVSIAAEISAEEKRVVSIAELEEMFDIKYKV